MESIGKIIAAYRRQHNMSQTDLANELARFGFQIKKSAISSWETGTSQPNASQFLALCRLLSITDIYNIFIGGYNPNDPLSELNSVGRDKVLDYINLLIKSGDYSRPDPGIIQFRRPIKLFNLPASAGTGEFLDSDDYELINVGSEVPEYADFGIRIHGNSMEPQYVNGQIVWVEQTKQLNNGEIGIFFLDGNAYCKKLKDDAEGLFLMSLNPDYNPITITETSDFLIFGRVVS